jgi:hypothetical protein
MRLPTAFAALLFTVTGLLGAAACNSGGSSTTDSNTGGSAGSTSTAGSGAAAGSGGTSTTGSGTTLPEPPTAYDTAHVLEVAVDMAPADWEKLRFETNDPWQLLGGDCLAGPRTTNFNYYDAAVSIDGKKFPKVAVRKKGFLGSLSVSKPSLKLKLDEYDQKAVYLDTAKITLNNGKQDGSLVRTCLALELFAKAGVPASRCSFAHVTVNGQDLGVYANVEPVEKPMLARSFESDKGNLYEGQMSDMRPEWQDTYEKKSNASDPDRSDIEALTAALAASDAELLSKVEPLLDVDAFLSFWAMEAVLASWDGYSNGQNNHFVYHDPTSGKLHFLPWGPDMTFDASDAFSPVDRPQSINARSAVPNRLYALPEIRAQYRDRLLEVLDKAMKPADVLAEIDRMQALLTPFMGTANERWTSGLADVRAFAKDRAGVLKKEVAGGPAEWPYGLSGNPCVVDSGPLNGAFSTTMGTVSKMDPFATGTGMLHLDVDAMPADANAVGCAASPYNENMLVEMIGAMPGGEIRIAVFIVDRTLWKAGADVPFDWQQAFGVYGTLDDKLRFVRLGWLNGGTLHLDEAGLNDGDPVSGTFTAEALGDAP